MDNVERDKIPAVLKFSKFQKSYLSRCESIGLVSYYSTKWIIRPNVITQIQYKKKWSIPRLLHCKTLPNLCMECAATVIFTSIACCWLNEMYMRVIDGLPGFPLFSVK